MTKVKVVSCVSAAAVALVASASFAQATPGFPGYALTTGNGGSVINTAGAVRYVAPQAGALSFNINGVVITCAANSGSTIAGQVNRGTYTSNTVGSVDASMFGSARYSGPVQGGGNVTTNSSPCTSTNGTIPYAFAGPSASAGATYTPWIFQVTGLSTTQPNPQGVAATGQKTPISITNVRMRVYFGRTNSCSFEIGGQSAGSYVGTATGGSLVGTYENTSPQASLSIYGPESNLRIWNAPRSGCFGGAFVNGQALTLGGSYAVGAVSPATNAIWLRS